MSISSRLAQGLFITVIAIGLSANNAHAAVGRTQGSFDVSASGAATYQIPIWMPPGPAGMQPHLALTYNSQSGDGTMGPGWSIAGLSAITRCNKTYAQDSVPAPVALAISDGYCLGGRRLRLTNGSYGAAGSTYQTELADFSLITASGVAGNGPASFTVLGKDGLTYEYGNTADSRIIATSSTTASSWLLNKVRDRAGNSYTVTYGPGYTGSVGVGVPLAVAYTPTGAGSFSYSYGVGFTYSNVTPAGAKVGYLSGTPIKNTSKLTAISVTNAAGTTLRNYVLTYEVAPATARDRLKQIKECADAAAINCLSPTTIAYQDGQPGVVGTPTMVINAADAIYGAVDINGDGRADAVYANGGVVYVAFATTSGFGPGVSTGITGISSSSTILFKDLTGTGKVGLFVNQGGTWNYTSWNGSAFVTTTSVADLSDGHTILADVTGDGLPDIVYSQSNYLWVRSNTSAGGVLFFSASPTQAMAVPTTSWWFSNPQGTPDRHAFVDVNGDGREDISITTYAFVCSGNPLDGTYVCNMQFNSQVYVAGGSTTATTLAASNFNTAASPVFYGHFNSDNCTDMLGGGGLVVISACNGSSAQYIAAPSSATVGFADWDGDGRDDVIVDNGGTLGVYLSQGDSLAPTMITTTIPTPPNATKFFANVVTFDQNGDGLDDLGFISGTGPYSFSYSLHNGSGTPPDLVTSITDGYGNFTKPTYVPITQGNYSPTSDAVYPYKQFIGPLYVVNQVTFSDPTNPPSGTYQKTYWYSGAWTNLQGRGFSGFYGMQSHDLRSGIWETFQYGRAFPYVGTLTMDLVGLNYTILPPISTVSNTWTNTQLSSTPYQERYFPYVSSRTAQQYESGGTKSGQLIATTTGTYFYDNYGNLTSSTTTVTDNDGTAPASPTYNQSWTSTVTNTITPNTANWCLGLPTQTAVTKSATGVTAITRTTSYTPDYVNCRTTQQVVEPSSTLYKVTTDLGYDSFGNVNSKTVTGVNMAARTTAVNWGTTGQFPVSVTNALNQTTQFGYDYTKGVRTSQTDPNNLTTSWQYDSFGRKTLETRPDNTSTLWSYSLCPCDPLPRLLVVEQRRDTSGTVMRSTNKYFDMLDRPIYELSQLIDGTTAWTTVRRYDSLGRVQSERFPYSSTGASIGDTTYTYDALNRIAQIQRPISATNATLQTTTIAYQGMTAVTTNPQNKTTTKITDPNGWMRRSQDANGYYQNFTYDAFGSLNTVVDSSSNALFSASYAYGVSAFQTQTVDMDLGTWNYTPNALGEVAGYSDAKGSAFSMTYDQLSRPLTRFVPGDGTTTWTWGNTAASFNIGRLQSITNTGGTTENYTYDNKGRLSQRQIVSDATYNYDYTYGATTGLLDTATYPTSTASYRLALKYVYQYGLLQQVKDNAAGTIFWQANAMNSRGQITQETLGNGIVTNRSYDAVTGWINSIQSGVGGGIGVQNEAYLFDTVGNVTQRQNNMLGLTENFYYDNVYRLDHSQLNGVTNLGMTYDPLGNITNRTDVASNATWTYDATKKHAVIQAGSASFTYSYDANGNASTRNGFAIGWNNSNYPTSIAGSGETASFYYDGNNQRWKQVYVNGSATETTMYVGGLLEKVTTDTTVDWRHYIKAGNQTVAVYSRQSTGTNTFRYMLEDHQGSVAKLTSDTGATYVSENFSAFGNLRNPATWSGAPTAADLININAVSREGYTGQDFIGSLGLNHMNGRMQDAIIGRFLSADPYISEPENTQNFNRYSYVYNNPLSLIDPTGFCGTSQTVSYTDSSGFRSFTSDFPCNDGDHSGPSMDMTFLYGPGGGSVPVHVRGEGDWFYPKVPPGTPADYKNKDATGAPQTQKPDPCNAGANAPKGLAATNKAFRNNTDPNTRFTADASQLTVRQTNNFDSKGRARGVVQGSDWLIYGQVTLQQNPGGSILIRPDQYNFEQHAVSKYSSPLRGIVRNVETYFGFYAATYGGLTEYWADLTGGNHATDFTSDFTCQPTVVR